jgi:hypothetical protein
MSPAIAAVAALAFLAFGCGGSKPRSNAAEVKLPTGAATTCAEACDRYAQCWQKQLGQQDATGDKAQCTTECEAKAPDVQQAYISTMAAETSCTAILNMK